MLNNVDTDISFIKENCLGSHTFQFYIAHGKYYAKYLSRRIGGMHDEYVFACILFYYGTLKI